MTSPGPLASAFLAPLDASERARWAALGDLEQSVAECIAQGHEAWPELVVEPTEFAHFLGASMHGEDVLASLTTGLHVRDLYLVCACLSDGRRALAALDRHCWSNVAAVLRRKGTPEAIIDDVRQALYERLLSGAMVRQRSPSGDASAGGYSGRGKLLAWLSVAALREARRLSRRALRDVAEHSDTRLLERLAGIDTSPELEYLKRRYERVFQAAFGDAVAQLTPRQRNLLRHSILEGLDLEQIGVMYGVHGSTVSRWIARARRDLEQATRNALSCRLKASEREVESILALINSRVNVTLRRVLSGTEPEQESE